MKDKRVYKEVARLIGKDLKEIVYCVQHFLLGLFEGAFGFFAIYPGMMMHRNANFKEKYEIWVSGGVITSVMIIFCFAGFLSIEYDDWGLFKTALGINGIFMFIWVGSRIKRYIKTKEEVAIKFINKKKSKGGLK